MRRPVVLRASSLLLLLAFNTLAVPPAAGQAQGAADYDIANGHFYTQASGAPGGVGYAITDDGGIPSGPGSSATAA